MGKFSFRQKIRVSSKPWVQESRIAQVLVAIIADVEELDRGWE